MLSLRLKPALATIRATLTLGFVRRQEFIAGEGRRVRDKDGPDGTFAELALPDGSVKTKAVGEGILVDNEGVVVAVV